MMITRPHWSYSQLSQFLRCPLQFYFDRIAKLPRPFRNSSLVLGSSVHEALAIYHRRLQMHQQVSSDDVKQAFLTAWKRSQQEFPIHFDRGESGDDLVEQGTALLEAYLAGPPPENIVSVEQTLLVPLYNSQGQFLERPLVAVLDLLSEGDQGLVVTEFKTSSKKYSDAQAAMALQPLIYAHAVREKWGEPAAVRFAVLVKTKTPQVQFLDASRSDDDFSRIGDVAQSIDLAIQAKAFYPIENPTNCFGCPFRLPCREWSGVNRPIVHPELSAVGELAAC